MENVPEGGLTKPKGRSWKWRSRLQVSRRAVSTATAHHDESPRQPGTQPAAGPAAGDAASAHTRPTVCQSQRVSWPGRRGQRCAERLPSRQPFSSSDCLGDAVISDGEPLWNVNYRAGTSCLRSLYRNAQMHQLSHKEDNAKAWRVLGVLLLLFLFSRQFFARKTPWTPEDPRLFSANFQSVRPSCFHPGVRRGEC